MTLNQAIARQKKILKLIQDRYTYEEIGKMFTPHITRQRVSQIAKHDYAAKKKLKGEPPSPPKTKK